MSADLEARLSRLEAANAALRGQLGAMSTEMIRGRSRRDAMSASDMNALLAPRSLANPIGARLGRDSTPDLGTPLLSRLRDDASVAGFAGGSIEGGYPNLLADPLFDSVGLITLGGGPVVIGTSYTAVSSEWEVRYVLNSGTAPASLHVTNPIPRGTAGNNHGYEHSSAPWVTITHGPSSGDVTVYLRAVTAFVGYSAFLPSWLTAAARLAGGGVSATATATGYVEIVDNTDTVIAQSDPINLATVDSLAESALAAAALESPAAATSYRWRLRLDLAGLAGDVELISVANPLLAFSDDGTPPPYTPAVGFMFTGGSGTPATVTFQGARCYRTAALSVSSGSDTQLTFPAGSATEEYDTDSFHDTSSLTHLFTIPEDGKYHIDTAVVWEANATGVRVLFLVRNGLGVDYGKDQQNNPSASSVEYLRVSVDLELAAGDTIAAWVRQTSGGALNVNGTDRNTYFNIHRVGGLTGATGATGAAGSLAVTTVEKDLGALPRYSGTFDITGLSGLTAAKQVVVTQAAAAYTGKGDLTDEAEMDPVTATGYVVDATTIRVYWASVQGPVSGNVKFNYQVSS